VTFEVHLPQIVRARVLKALPRSWTGQIRSHRAQAPQDRDNRAGRRHSWKACRNKRVPQLSRSPAGVLFAQPQKRLFNLR
jgi:hypothetical protein